MMHSVNRRTHVMSHGMPHDLHESMEDHEGTDVDEGGGHMNFVDGRCSCCPYGYHVDLDFLRFSESLNSAAYLSNLKKIRHNKRMLRKSMEVMLQQQQRASDGDLPPGPPPDVVNVNSAENFMNFVQYENSTTNKFLEEIDSSVNQTLSSIDGLMLDGSGKKRKYGAHVSDSEDTEDDLDGPGARARLRNKYRTEAELWLAHQQQQQAGSMSSLSSHDTYSSEQYGSLTSSQSNQYAPRTFKLTSQQLAGTMATLLPHDGHHDTSGDSSSQYAAISPDQLAAIREQMAISLQRMKELEEQVKAIPVLQVRISVLKEEKRLLALQLKAKNNKMNMRTVGVGDCRVDDILLGLDGLDGTDFQFDKDHEYRTYMEVNLAKTIPPQRPRPPMRTIGTGDGNVHEYGMIQTTSTSESEGVVRERELHTEQSSHVVEKEKEIHALLIGQDKDRSDSKIRKMERPYKPPTRSIGVGDANVFDTGNNVHVHEKELRTVIIGGAEKVKNSRNVGVLCKAAMRDVGVSYLSSDVAQNTRTVAVGVGEGLFGGDLMDPLTTSQHISYNTLQQMNMAAFHSRNIKINWAELLPLLDEKLKKTVRSVAVMCKIDQPAQRDVGIQSVISSQVSVGVGSDTVDVEVRPIKTMRSFAVEAKPTIVHRGYQTDKGYQKDMGVNTIREQQVTKAVNTTPVTTFPAATNTEAVKLTSAGVGTELKIFQAMDQVRNVTTNTPVIQKYNFGVNTDEEPKVPTQDRATATQKEFSFNKAINTDPPKVSHMGVGNNDVHKSLMPEKPPTRHAAVGISPSVTHRGVGDGFISHSDVYDEPTQKDEDEVQQVQESMVRAQKVVTTKVTNRRYGYNENDNNNLSRYGLETDDDRLKASPEGTPSNRYTTETRTTRSYGSSPSETKSEEEPPNTSSSPERIGSSRYTVETHTTRSYGSGPGRTETTRTTKNYGALAEPVTKTTEYTTSSKKTSSPAGDNEDFSGGYLARYGSGAGSDRDGGYSRTTTTTTNTSRQFGGSGADDEDNEGGSSDMLGGYRRTTTTTKTSRRTGGSSVDSEDIGDGSAGSSERMGGYSRKTITTTKSNKSYGGLGGASSDDSGSGLYGAITTTITKSSFGKGSSGATAWDSSSSGSSRSGKSSGKSEYDSESSGSGGGGAEDGGQQMEWITDASGNTKMRVIRSVETTYVGERPVHQSSNVVIQDDGSSGGEDSTGTVRRVLKSEQEVPERDVSPGSFRRITKSSTQESRSEPQSRTITKEYSSSTAPQHLHGRTVTVTETRVEHRRDGAEVATDSPTRENGKGIKSILKEPGSQSPNIKKKEIKFAEGTVGGYVSSSGESSDSDGDGRGGGGGSGAGGEDDGSSQDSLSFDEGSYDGRIGKITYRCQDDEAIEQGVPGASMFDQNIRETYELNAELQNACHVYAKWLQDSTQVNTKQLNSSQNVIQQEWFKISSHKLSNPSMVEDFLSSFKEISNDLLSHVVNMQDANGNTSLHYAVSHCNLEIVGLLLDTEACDVDKPNKAGYTPIMLASLAQIQTDRHRNIIRRLFSQGDINARASQAGQTALMLAVSHGRTDMVRLLLEEGTDVNLQDDDGSTALMCACEHGHTEIVKILLANPDCDPSITDNDGSNALSIAMEAGHRDVGVLLYAHVNFKQGSPVLTRAKLKQRSSSSSSISTSPTTPRSPVMKYSLSRLPTLNR